MARLINAELRRLLSSWATRIAIVLIILLSIAFPVWMHLEGQLLGSHCVLQTDKTVRYEGQTISCANIAKYDYDDLVFCIEKKDELESMESGPINTMAIELLTLNIDGLIDKCLYATEDYQRSLHLYAPLFPFMSMDMHELRTQRYIFKHVLDEDTEYLEQALCIINFVTSEHFMIDFQRQTNEEQQVSFHVLNEAITMWDKVLKHNDHKAYYRFMITEYGREIAVLEAQIVDLEKNADKHADVALYLSIIKNNEQNIQELREVQIATTQYCMDHDIPPTHNDWRFAAVTNKKGKLQSCLKSQPVSRDIFENDTYLRNKHRSYRNYTKVQQSKINAATKDIRIIDLSLEANQPDMQFCYKASRKGVTDYLWFSIVISLFAIILASPLVSREHEVGTIRLWLIRPQKRYKLLLSRFFAVLMICFVLYVVTTLLSIINYGILRGFDDYKNPVFTAFSSHGVPFFVDFALKCLACFMSILFACALSCLLSTITKNTAVAAGLTLVLFIGLCALNMYILSSLSDPYSNIPQWVLYSPAPFVNMNFVFLEGSSLLPPVSYGCTLLVVIAAAMTVGAVMTLKYRDI